MEKVIKISGVIIPNNYQDCYDWFGIEATSPKKVSAGLADLQLNDNVTVEINSGGGDVFSGSEIYTSLKQAPNNVTVKIMGIAASAASVIAMAGDKVLISPTAQIMIHNVSSYASGDYRDMQHSATVLENANKAIANAYQLKTGLNQQQILDYMNRESWLNAQQAKDLGFADEVMFDSENRLIASVGNNMLPIEVINKFKNLTSENKQKDLIALEQERLSLLNLRR